MRRMLVVAMLFGLAGSTPALAQSAQGAIRAVIGDQIAAFRADDLEQSFTYASPTIRGIFQTPQNFGAMVQGGYPMVWRPSRVTYLGLRRQDGAEVERILAVDAAGRGWLLDYRMVKVGGAWKIDGVWLVPQTGAGV